MISEPSPLYTEGIDMICGDQADPTAPKPRPFRSTPHPHPEFPALETWEGRHGRRSRLRHGPEVSEVVRVRRSYGDDRNRFYSHFAPAVPPEALDQALAFAARHPDHIESELARPSE